MGLMLCHSCQFDSHPSLLSEQSLVCLSPHFCQSNISHVVIFLLLSTAKFKVGTGMASSFVLTEFTLNAENQRFPHTRALKQDYQLSKHECWVVPLMCSHVAAESWSLGAIWSGNLCLARILSGIWWDSLREMLTSMWSRATPIALARTWFWVGSSLLAQVADPCSSWGQTERRGRRKVRSATDQDQAAFGWLKLLEQIHYLVE